MSYTPNLETERLVLRPWTLSEADRAFFHHLHSDEQVRRFYVTCMGREKSDSILENLVTAYQEDAPQWLLATLKQTGEPIGFTGLANVTYSPPGPCVETGWQYTPSAWGNGYVTEAAQELLRHGFEDLNLLEIVAFAVVKNEPSIAVMKRLGMVEKGHFPHPKVPLDTHAHLSKHMLMSITGQQWRARTNQQSQHRT